DDRTQVYVHPYSSDGSRVACETTDGSVAVWDVRNDRPRVVSLGVGHRGGVAALSFFPDGSMVVSAGHDGTVRVWDSATGVCVATLRGHTGGIRGISVSPDGTTLASASNDGTVRLWETSSAIGETWLLAAPHKVVQFMDMTFSADNKSLFVVKTIAESGETT